MFASLLFSVRGKMNHYHRANGAQPFETVSLSRAAVQRSVVLLLPGVLYALVTACDSSGLQQPGRSWSLINGH